MESTDRTPSSVLHTAENARDAPEGALAGDARVREEARRDKEEGNMFLRYGLGIGAFGVVTGVLGAAVCPLCVVATPALLGAGIYKRIKAKR